MLRKKQRKSSARLQPQMEGKSRFAKGWRRFRQQIYLQCMVVPAIVWVIIFCYIPMYGVIIAFTDYKPSMGFFGGKFVGLKHFRAFFADKIAVEAIWNTLIISALKLLFGFPAPIIFALLLNEVMSPGFKKFIQTVSYLPFFISWVILASIMQTLLGMDGPIMDALVSTGILEKPIAILGMKEHFRTVAVVSDIWKGVGWSSILYTAAIASIPQEQYESAFLDGASRWQRVFHITIPSILPTICIQLILASSGILGSNFDQHYLLGNQQVLEVAETIDTYVFKMGLSQGRYSYATAVSLGRAVISFVLLFITDRVIRWLSDGEQGLF